MAEMKVKYPDFDFTFSGHSRGGAYATIASAKYQQEGYKVKGLITYGSPRVATANSKLIKVVQDNISFRRRYVLSDVGSVKTFTDLVPEVPPKSLGFAHIDEGIPDRIMVRRDWAGPSSWFSVHGGYVSELKTIDNDAVQGAKYERVRSQKVIFVPDEAITNIGYEKYKKEAKIVKKKAMTEAEFKVYKNHFQSQAIGTLPDGIASDVETRMRSHLDGSGIEVDFTTKHTPALESELLAARKSGKNAQKLGKVLKVLDKVMVGADAAFLVYMYYDAYETCSKKPSELKKDECAKKITEAVINTAVDIGCLAFSTLTGPAVVAVAGACMITSTLLITPFTEGLFAAKDQLGEAVESFKEAISIDLENGVDIQWDKLGEGFLQLLAIRGAFYKGFFKGLETTIIGIGDGLTTAGEWIGGAVTDAVEWGEGAVEDTINWTGGATKWIGKAAEDASKWVGKAAEDAGKWVGKAAENSSNWVKKTWTNFW
eukprot:Pgem_evm1s14130